MQLIPKLQTGYATTSLKTQNVIIVSADDSARFAGFAFDGQSKYGKFRIGKRTVYQLCFPSTAECKQCAFGESDLD